MRIIIGLSFIVGGILIGYRIGYKARTKEINNKIENLKRLADCAKERNNKMVDTASKIYQMSPGYDPSKITEMDEILSAMWID